MFSDFSPAKAKKLQNLLSKKVIHEDCLLEPVRYVAGVDVSYTNGTSFGIVVVLEYDSLKIMEKQTSCMETHVPYIPSFLSFRELPIAVSAIRKLQIRPDVFLVDGHGIAHPRRFGFASHLGIVLNTPTIGVAKNLLCGEVKGDGEKCWKSIIYKGKEVGAAVFVRISRRPIYVSIGHRVSLEKAIKIVLHCLRGYKIPEPLRQAHMIAEGMKRSLEFYINMKV